MPPTYFPLRWESTGDQWWYASPIDWAAANGHYDLVRELLHLDTNLLIKLTSLRRIRRLETVWDDEEQFEDVAKCRSQIARKLLLECENRRGPQKNSLIRAGYGGWLLYTAASAGDVEFVNQLLGIDPFLVFGEGEYGVTDVFYAAARSKNPEVFRLLLDFSISPRFCERGAESESVFRREMMNRAVHAAARGGNVVVLRELLKECSDVLGYRDAQGSTLLHSAACRGQLEVVKDLLASYDNIINSKDNHGNTALHVAAYRGHLSILDPLISASPSLTSSTNNNGETFLHMAVSSFRPPGFRRVDRQMDFMKHLLSGKIVNIHEIVNHRNNDGITALHLAVIDNVQTDLVELLMLANSINLNIRDSHGMTPLDLLRRRPRSASSEVLIRRLISAGGIANCRDLISRNALASSLKLQGIGGSPGTSFGIPDSEIVTYTVFDNGSESYSYSGELSQSNSVSGALSSAARRLKILLQWPRKNEKFNKDDDSLASSEMCRDSENSGIPLRDSENVGIPLRQRFSMRNNHPSPLTKKKFSAGLMHGVIQVTPQSSPSSPFSESSSSWVSPNKPKGLDIGKSIAGPLGLHRRQTSFNKRLMNGYLCFGSQGLAIEDSISCT